MPTPARGEANCLLVVTTLSISLFPPGGPCRGPPGRTAWGKDRQAKLRADRSVSRCWLCYSAYSVPGSPTQQRRQRTSGSSSAARGA